MHGHQGGIWLGVETRGVPPPEVVPGESHVSVGMAQCFATHTTGFLHRRGHVAMTGCGRTEEAVGHWTRPIDRDYISDLVTSTAKPYVAAHQGADGEMSQQYILSGQQIGQ